MPEELNGIKRCKFCKWSKSVMVEQEDLFGLEEPRRYLLHLCYRYTGQPLLKTEVCDLFELDDDKKEDSSN
jgi:hypothetical protein